MNHLKDIDHDDEFDYKAIIDSILRKKIYFVAISASSAFLGLFAKKSK